MNEGFAVPYQFMLKRMLGIPESAAEPGPYEVLGLDPGESDCAAITEALQNRKRQLRQNIPGPRFIPLLALFEKDLDAAAAVLLDPAKRAAYLEQRRRLGKQGKRQRLEEARNRFSVQVQQIIRSSLNPDGSLNDEQRALLAERLQQLRFVEHKIRLKLRQDDIDAIMDRIPRAAPEAGEDVPNVVRFFQEAIDAALADDFLSPEDEQRLAELARRLGMDPDAAREMVDAAVKANGAWRPFQADDELKLAPLDEPAASAASATPVGPPVEASIEPVPVPWPEHRRMLLVRVVVLMVPVVAILAFAAFAVIAVKRHARQTAPVAQPRPPGKTTVTPKPPPQLPSTDHDAPPEPPQPPQPPSKTPEPPVLPAPVQWETLSLKELRECYTRTDRSDELLADAAVSLLACCVRMDALVTGKRTIAGRFGDYRTLISDFAGTPDDEQPDDPLPIPYRRHLKLVSVATRYARFLKAMLQGWSKGEHKPTLDQLEDLEDPPATPGVIAEFASATGEVTAVLGGIVRRHPRGRPVHLARADFIENEREVRSAASENALQEVAAGLDAVGDLLEVLIGESAPEGASAGLIRRAQAGLNQDDARRNVLFEIRENACRIVALLDVLLSLQ